MSVPARAALAVLLVAALGILGMLIGGGDDGGTGEATVAENVVWESARQCLPCHQDVWDEWYGSHHQISYLNPDVRALSDDFRNKECQACHLPQPIALTGFAQRTLPRQTRPDEGVGCISCHLGADGRIMSVRGAPDAPCAPVAHAEFASVAQCESCHNQHFTTDQYRASRYPTEGVHCNDCHMLEVERQSASGETRQGRSHVFPGAHDTDMLKAAGRFTVVLEGGELVLSLENRGAGHNFPTEERHRAVDMMYRFVTPDGEAGDWQLAYRCRQPYRDEAGEDTQLPAGETVTARVALPDDVAAVEARLWYRLKPYVDDDDPASTLLDEKRIEVP